MFEIGQNSLDVAKIIVASYPEISELQIIYHPVDKNWRQKNKSDISKLKNIDKCFRYYKPLITKAINRTDFLKLNLNNLTKQVNAERVWSLVSRVKCKRSFMHLPMMNFHLENYPIDYIVKSIRCIAGDKEGVILDSGRFQHYYGNYLLNETEWIKFMSNFLMPCIIVSPRYIGHRLYDGYCTLRLTSSEKYKPVIPKVIKILNTS